MDKGVVQAFQIGHQEEQLPGVLLSNIVDFKCRAITVTGIARLLNKKRGNEVSEMVISNRRWPLKTKNHPDQVLCSSEFTSDY